MPIAPYDPYADDREDAEIHGIDDLIQKILHGGDDPTTLGRWQRIASS